MSRPPNKETTTDPTPLVLVHGNPENDAVWSRLLSALDRSEAFLLSPPGFGVPIPDGFDLSATGYRRWLASRLEVFGRPGENPAPAAALREFWSALS